MRALGLALCLALVACTRNFDVFDPALASDAGDAGAPPTTTDASTPDATSTLDAAPGPDDAAGPDADAEPPPFDGNPSCGADCRTEATSCAGTCAQVEQSCAAACSNSGCVTGCQNKEATCVSTCVTQCETCTSQDGCIDPAGCKAAAP